MKRNFNSPLVSRRHSRLLPQVETWPSGRRRSPAKGVGPEGSRGFESHRLRHLPKHNCSPARRRAENFRYIQGLCAAGCALRLLGSGSKWLSPRQCSLKLMTAEFWCSALSHCFTTTITNGDFDRFEILLALRREQRSNSRFGACIESSAARIIRLRLLTGAVFVKGVVRRFHAASLISGALISFSGFSQTGPAGCQLRVLPDQRSGFCARAFA